MHPEYAAHLFDELSHKLFDRELLDEFVRGVSEGGMICDMGCGPGHVTRYLHARGATVLGLDYSSGMVNEVMARNPGIRFIEGDMKSLPLDDESLAGIVAFYSIVNFHQSELNRAMSRSSSRFGHTVGFPWRRDQKLATLAALLALKQQTFCTLRLSLRSLLHEHAQRVVNRFDA